MVRSTAKDQPLQERGQGITTKVIRRLGGEGQRLYAKVAENLASRIAAGEFAVGQRLPGERDLAQAFSVSRPTIREAIIALEIDGLVEVRMGSGVYVVQSAPPSGEFGDTDAGPFEILDARRALEGEVCALAALRITDAQVNRLYELAEQMDAQSEVAHSEAADYEFHMLIAEATQNMSLVSAVKTLWDARSRSPQYKSLTRKAIAAGVVPKMDEHRLIADALRDRDPDAARGAMRGHLSRVIDTLLRATEVEQLEKARAEIERERQRYAVDI